MKKDTLKIIIRKIVREEVAMAIQEVLTELKHPKNSAVKKSPKKKIIKKNEYTKNSVLNEILNETANSDDWKTLNGGAFTTNNMEDVLSKSYNVKNRKSSSDHMISSMGDSQESIPDHVTNALTKDYSELMNKINNTSKR